MDQGPFDGPLDPVDPLVLERPMIVGVGAVGCALIYALILAEAKGRVLLLDPDTVGDTNLMRYVLFDDRHLDQEKVAAAKALVAATGLDLVVETSATAAKGYLSDHPAERERLELAVSAVDTYEARRQLASELPREILNAGTTESDFTVSRHRLGDGLACLACLYPARETDTDLDAVAARELGLAKAEVAQLRESRTGLTRAQLAAVARKREEPEGLHFEYEGEPLDTFYRKVVCGTTPVETPSGEVYAPLAHGSALAGILLARGLADDDPPMRKFRMNFLTGAIPERQQRTSPAGRKWCPNCARDAMRKAYEAKWGEATKTT